MSGEKDFLDEFADEDGIDVAPVIEQPAPTDMEPAGSGRQRGPDGKFIKAEAQAKAEQAEKGAQEAVQTAVTEPPSDDDETGTVPIHVLKALRKENQELKARMGQQSQPKAPEFSAPQVDFEQDPKAHMISLKMQMSAFMAAQQNDEQTVNEAWTAFDQACAANPDVSQMSYRLVNHPHPMAEIVKWYKRERELSAIQEAGGLEALKQRWLAEQGITAPQGQTQARPNLPPSLAGTGKARSSEVNSVDADPFDAVFKKR
jgi:hypothetical protein